MEDAKFQSTPSLRRATGTLHMFVFAGTVSIHALLAESDLERMTPSGVSVKFQSTPSLRRATYAGDQKMPCIKVSIHALLAESDVQCVHVSRYQKGFNPRPPCGERRSPGILKN